MCWTALKRPRFSKGMGPPRREEEESAAYMMECKGEDFGEGRGKRERKERRKLGWDDENEKASSTKMCSEAKGQREVTDDGVGRFVYVCTLTGRRGKGGRSCAVGLRGL